MLGEKPGCSLVPVRGLGSQDTNNLRQVLRPKSANNLDDERSETPAVTRHSWWHGQLPVPNLITHSEVGTHGRLLRYDSSIDVTYTSRDRRYASSKFLNADPVTIDRHGSAVPKRRMLLSYRKRHQQSKLWLRFDD